MRVWVGVVVYRSSCVLWLLGAKAACVLHEIQDRQSSFFIHEELIQSVGMVG